MINSQEENQVLGIDPQVAFDKLAQFDTPGEIAEFLQEQGIKAIPRNASGCALSKYMKETTELDTSTVYFFINISGEDGLRTQQFATTDAMRIFISQFDDRRYPELIL